MDPLCRVVLSKTASAAPAPVPAQASAPAPAPPSSPSLSSPPSLSPPRSSSASLTSSSKTNSPRSDTGHSADASYAMDRHQTPPQLNTNARPSWIYANSQKDAQQSIQQSILPYRAAAPRGVTSPNWRAAQQHPVDVGVWGHAAQSNYTLGSVALPKVETPSGGLEGYAYCLDRGNGQYTRLIPADVLPPLNEIPARQPGPPGMVILPDLQSAPPQGVAPLNRPVTIMTWRDRDGPASDSLQNHIDQIVAASPVIAKRPKIYCDKWIHDGQCAFAQQGCKFKHEMPFDKATQHSLGLFQGLPGWWKRLQVELRKQDEERRGELGDSATASPLSLTLTNQVGAAARAGWRDDGCDNMPPRVPPELNLKNLNKRHDAPRPLSTGSTVGSAWSLVGPQGKPSRSTALIDIPIRRNTWAPRGGNYPGRSPTNKAA